MSGLSGRKMLLNFAKGPRMVLTFLNKNLGKPKKKFFFLMDSSMGVSGCPLRFFLNSFYLSIHVKTKIAAVLLTTKPMGGSEGENAFVDWIH